MKFFHLPVKDTLTIALRKYNYDSDDWKLSSSNRQSDFVYYAIPRVISNHWFLVVSAA